MIKKLHNLKGIQFSNIFILLMMLVGSVNFAATNEELAAIEIAACNAGADNTSTEFCLAEAQAKFKTVNDAKLFYLSLLDSGVPTNGVFNPSMSRIGYNFSKNPIGVFKTTYTVTDGSCSDSTDLVVTVVPAPNAGPDNTSNVFCLEAIQQMINRPEDLENLYKSFLKSGVATNGTFNPTIDQIINSFEDNPIGTFSTTYTVRNGQNCTDTAELSIDVIPNPNAGVDNLNNSVCYSNLEQSLSTVESATAYFRGLVDSGADSNGTFSPSIQTLMNSFNSNPFETLQTEYVVIAAGCEDRATLSVTFKDGSYAGKDNTNNVMTRSESKAQFKTVGDAKAYYLGLLDAGVPKNGTFNPSMNRIAYNYTKNNIGTFRTVYTFTSNGCTDSTVLSLTIVEDANRAQANTSKAQASNSDTSSSLVIYNLSGGVVKTSKVDATETFNKNSSTFSDSNLKRGIYIYKLNDGNGVISTKKIIVE